jgi:hypothetical protein
MFLIAITNPGGQIVYWSGGEVFSIHVDEAARFLAEADAFNTIDLIRKAVGISPTATVVPLPDESDD